MFPCEECQLLASTSTQHDNKTVTGTAWLRLILVTGRKVVFKS